MVQATIEKSAGVLAYIDELIDEINASDRAKTAADDNMGIGKSPKTDPGSKGGPSSHPSAKADGGNQTANFGAHGKELTEEVKKLPDNVDASGQMTNSDSDNNQIQIGVKKTPTGEDPAVEQAYKGHKDDPGTSMPASVEGGEKYSSMTFESLYKMACDATNNVLTRLAVNETVKTAVAADVGAAAAAGAALADAVIAAGDPATKQAAAQELVASAINEGYRRAELVGQYLYKRAEAEAQMAKRADPDPGLQTPDPSQLPPEMGGGPPPGMGGGGPPPEMAGGPPGMPPDAAAPLPDAAAAGAHTSGGGGPSPHEGGGGDEESVNELANALIDSGIPVDALISALQHAQGDQATGEKMSAAQFTPQDRQALLWLSQNVIGLEKSGKFKRYRREQLGKEAQQNRDGLVDYLSTIREVFARR